MRSIHQFFVGADQYRVRECTKNRGRKSLCWYPSAGTDFRHILFFEKERFNKLSPPPPMIYLHTDMELPKNSGVSSKSRSYQPGDFVAPSIRIASISEISIKVPILSVNKDVYFGKADENTGKVFLIDLLLEHRFRECSIQIPVPVIYFIAENFSFLADFLLLHQMQVNTLIHIRDGGASLGGSRIPMNFIYQSSSLLKLKRVICDQDPQKKIFDITRDFEVYHNHMCLTRHQWKKANRCYCFHEKLKEISRSEIQASWKGYRLSQEFYPPNKYPHLDGFYYDWHPWENRKM